jgi:hypothetical protein
MAGVQNPLTQHYEYQHVVLATRLQVKVIASNEKNFKFIYTLLIQGKAKSS